MSEEVRPRKATAEVAAPRARPSVRGELLALLGVGAAASALLVVVLQLWRAKLHVPLYGGGGDAALTLSIVKGMLAHPGRWIWSNPDIGAPLGTHFQDYPAAAGDTLHLAVMQVMGRFSSDPVAVVNVFFLLTFPLAAMTAFGVLRAMGIARASAGLGGLLFAFVPYHFWRNEAHLGLAAYYVVPLGVWLVHRVAQGEPLVAGRRTATTLGTVGCVLVVGLGGLYYALFTATLLVLVGLVAFAVHRRVARLVEAGAGAAALLALVFLAQLPAFVYQHSHGVDAAVARRVPQESEIYGLKLAAMLLPPPGHRFAFMGDIGSKYISTTIVPGEGSGAALGVILSLALLAALGFLVTRGAPRRGREGEPGVRLLQGAGLIGGMAFFVGTVGGGSTVFAYLVSSQVRAWNRISIVIAFAAVMALCGLLAMARRRVGVPAFAAILAGLAVVGFLDQTSPRGIPDYAAIRAQWSSDARFVGAVEAVAPPGGEVLQLPYVPFPENPPVVKMQDYDQFKGYLHSRRLRWSYGAIKGRPSDWLAGVDVANLGELVPAAVAAGFDGIWVDQNGYADRGDAVAAQLTKLVGIQHASLSDDKRVAYWDLRDYARTLAARTDSGTRAQAGAAIVRPPLVAQGAGFGDRESDGVNPFYWAGADARLSVTNELGRPEPVDITAVLATPTPAPARVTITWPGGRRQTLTVRSPRPIKLSAVLPPGDSEVRFATDGPPGPISPADTRDRRLQIVNLRFTDAAVDRLQREAAAQR